MPRGKVGPACAPGEMTGRAARLALGNCTPNQLMNLVALGRIRVIAHPGTSLRYNAEDVARVAAERSAAAC